MAIAIAKLSTISTLDSTQFSKGLSKMRTDIGAFSAVSFGAFSRIGGMITEFGRRAISSLPRIVMSSLQAGDALNELASQLGFSTEALANLQRVAGLSGIDIGALETNLGKLSTVLGEALGGNKAAQKSFTDLGLSFQELESKRPEETFFAVLDALKQIPSQARRSSAAVELFGRSGRSMLKLIGLGSAGINAEANSTRRLGIASRPSDLAAMERANDTLDDLKNNLKGFGDQLAIRLAPKIEQVGQDFLGFSKNTHLAANAAEYFAQSLQTVSLWMAGMGDTLGFTTGAQDALYKSINKLNQTPTTPTAPTDGKPTRQRPKGPAWGGRTSGAGPEELENQAILERMRQNSRKATMEEQTRSQGRMIGVYSPAPTTPASSEFIRAIEANTKATEENTRKQQTGGARP